MAFQPALAILSIRITQATANGVAFQPGAGIPLTSTQPTIPIRMEFTATRDAADMSPIREFRCSWDMGPYLRGNCSAPTPETRTSTGWEMRGSSDKVLGAGRHIFSVIVLNSLTTPTIRTATFPFEITPPTVTISPTTIDTSYTPNARVYKANSYPIGGGGGQYHFQNFDVTPFNNMWLVFEAFYGTRSDLFERNVGTTFECRWDTSGPFGPCGRFNTITSISPGMHFVDFRAKNAAEAVGPEAQFTWCVNSCVAYFDYRAISSADIRSYNSAAPDESFYSGKNETKSLEDLKQFQILNVTAGASNETLTVQELKEFPIINETIGDNNNVTNFSINTNITNFSVKEAQANQSGK